MKLKCRAKCIKILKKTQTKVFKDLQVGDIMDFSIAMGSVGSRSGGGTYAPEITFVHERTGESNRLSFNQIENALKKFEFEEISYE